MTPACMLLASRLLMLHSIFGPSAAPLVGLGFPEPAGASGMQRGRI